MIWAPRIHIFPPSECVCVKLAKSLQTLQSRGARNKSISAAVARDAVSILHNFSNGAHKKLRVRATNLKVLTEVLFSNS